MDVLHGKNAVVTGGNSGIGLAAALAFDAEGARVAITGRDKASLAAAAAQLSPGCLAVPTDVTRLADLDQLFAQVIDNFGLVDVLFVNAGISRFTPLDKVDEAQFDEVMNTNFKGAFFTIQRALPHLREGASIILCGSCTVNVSVTGWSVYAASKAALHSLARSLTSELQPRSIRINTLVAGYIETPLYGRAGLAPEAAEEAIRAITQRLPAGRFGQPAELAGALVLLASDASKYMLGSELVIDGGLTAQGL